MAITVTNNKTAFLDVDNISKTLSASIIHHYDSHVRIVQESEIEIHRSPNNRVIDSQAI
jgi:hypothetical protein